MKKSIIILAAAVACLSSCVKEEMIPAGRPEYTLTVNAHMDGPTKGLFIEGGQLKIKWYGTDQVSVYPEAWSEEPMGALTASASETGSTFLTGVHDFGGANVSRIRFILI